MKQEVRRGLRWLLPCMLLLMAGVVCAEDFVTLNQGVIFRQTDGEVVWSTTDGITGTPTLLEVGPDGNVYLSTSNNQDCLTWDGETGEYLGANITNIGHRLYDICFGPDIDGDGIEDLYTFGGGDPSVKSYTSSSGYTVQGSWICTLTTAWVGDFGPDVTGDGYQELYLLPDLAQNTSNICIVIDGANPTTELYNFPIPEVVRPGCLVGGTDGRIYVTGRNNDVVASYLPDGTDAQVVAGIDTCNFSTQIAEGEPGEWYVSNRFNVTGLPADAGSVTYSTDNFVSSSILIAGTEAADLFQCIATFNSGAPRGAAHSPVPTGTWVDSEVVSSVSWYSPEQDSDGNSLDDPNIASIDGYDVYWSLDPNYLTDTPVSVQQIPQSYTPTTAITYDTTYFWRVDTYVTWDSNTITGNFTDVIEGAEWVFTTKPDYVPPVLSFNSVITTLDIMPTTLSATVSNNSDPMGGPSFTLLTDDAEFPSGATASVSNTTVDNQNPTATLTTDMAGIYKVLLVVSDGTTPQQAIAEVDVYADACQAQKDAGGWSANYYDRDDNCVVDMVDFSVFASEWLDSTAMDASEEYTGVVDYVPQAVFDARIEAEWFDPNDPNVCSDGPANDTNGIRIQDQPNASGLKATGYSSATAWVEYTITVPVSAVGVAVDVYAGHALNGSGTVTLSFGTEATPDAYGVGTLDGTGNWTAFTDGRKIGEVTFDAAGSQIVRTSYGGGLNLDWFSFDF